MKSRESNASLTKSAAILKFLSRSADSPRPSVSLDMVITLSTPWYHEITYSKAASCLPLFRS